MTIGEVSRKLGVGQDTLRYYERIGMIPPVTRNASGLRDYTEEDLRWVELALCMRGAGLTVQALTEYVRLCRMGEESVPWRVKLLQEQKEELLKQRQQIDAALARLERKIGRYETH